METTNFIHELDRVARVRAEIASNLNQIKNTLEQSESAGEQNSGKLGLERDIEDIYKVSKNLQQGRFRLLVLGDMKRGKSTFLNALIGENLLPSDVNPCTALLTVLRYGAQKKVTVYFNDETLPQEIDLESFKHRYTIDPDQAKRLEQEQKLAFPNVSHAVVQYPLPLLEKGIEIVDSPGLNDTEARNELSLSYINNCHAILFVLKATQPCTLEERRYIENYLKGRGLTVFFLINAWDEIRKGLIDPEDSEELAAAEEKVRQVFQANLMDYFQVEAQTYQKRVFEISSLIALRRRVKNSEDSLEGTGFPELMAALNSFLTKERAIAEMRQAKILAQQVYNHVHEAIERRIPLLDQDVNQLKQQISEVAPEFEKLTEIRDQFQEEIRITRNRTAKAVANSFRDYILNLGNTFESDFVRYQPDLGFLDFLRQGKRDEFNAAFKRAFERYINEKISDWEVTAEQKISQAFLELARSAANYGAIYGKIADAMTEKLIGKKVYTNTTMDSAETSPTWASWAMGFLSLASGNVAGVFLAGAGFDWKNILVNWFAVWGITSFLLIFTTTFTTALIGPLYFALMGLGVGALQADQARKQLIQATKKELVNYLPKLAEEQWQPIHDAVNECFDDYERQVIKRLNDDIKSRKDELDNLVEQKESNQVNRETELKRLRSLDADVLSKVNGIESVYGYLLAAPM
ncbi:dynamin family protein [Moorena sp. SIOASIH]|uniref:dynamin family protein n=1 Tax=Moorena sp. SIOASIH TaxID=2607817 RepID=UPI00344F76C4